MLAACCCMTLLGRRRRRDATSFLSSVHGEDDVAEVATTAQGTVGCVASSTTVSRLSTHFQALVAPPAR